MKIYTKTGDDGSTSLYSGKRVKKNDPFIEAVGALDECNCFVGLAHAQLSLEQPLDVLREQFVFIQHALFDLGAHVATPLSEATEEKLEKTRFDNDATKELERWIDKLSKKLPKLKTFILPGGDPAGATVHVARSVCRRAERLLIPLVETNDILPEALHYINRLSDYLFMAARFINVTTHTKEIAWTPHIQESPFMKWGKKAKS